jgi:hypothetical protein
MEDAWRQWQQNMRQLVPEITEDKEVKQLASRLAALAPHLHDALKSAGAQTGKTLVHGDFKSANLFFCAASSRPSSQNDIDAHDLLRHTGALPNAHLLCSKGASVSSLMLQTARFLTVDLYPCALLTITAVTL